MNGVSIEHKMDDLKPFLIELPQEPASASQWQPRGGEGIL